MSFWRFTSGEKKLPQSPAGGSGGDDKGLLRAYRAVEQKIRLDWSGKGAQNSSKKLVRGCSVRFFCFVLLEIPYVPLPDRRIVQSTPF